MKLSQGELADIVSAIPALDGDPANKIFYKFDHKTRLRMVRNLRKARTVVRDLQEARTAAFHAASGGKDDVAVANGDSVDMVQKVKAAMRQFDAEPVEVDIHPVHLNDLKLEENEVPMSAVAALAPIIEGFEDGESKTLH